MLLFCVNSTMSQGDGGAVSKGVEAWGDEEGNRDLQGKPIVTGPARVRCKELQLSDRVL